MNVEKGAARLFLALISLYYIHHLFCRDKTMCVEALHKEGEEEEKRCGERDRRLLNSRSTWERVRIVINHTLACMYTHTKKHSHTQENCVQNTAGLQRSHLYRHSTELGVYKCACERERECVCVCVCVCALALMFVTACMCMQAKLRSGSNSLNRVSLGGRTHTHTSLN